MSNMNSSRNMKRGRKGPPFIKLDHPMFDSEAFNALSSSGVRVLLSIMRRKNGKNGTDEAPIECPYQAMNGNMGRATIAKAIRELQAKGFIELARHGGLMKQTNLFVFSGEWCNWRKKQNTSSEIEPDRFRN